MMRAIQPSLHGFPVNHVARIVEVQEATVVGPDGVFSSWNLNITSVGAGGAVVGIAREIACSEEWQRVVIRSDEG